jgi:S1-C subfamily serine protease
VLCCPAGILVLSARDDGPAFRAGIMGTSRDAYGRLVLGDIITAVNGQAIKKVGGRPASTVPLLRA